MSRSVKYLYDQISNAEGASFALRASYCEIYNEALYDLLKFSDKQLPVRWDTNRGFHADGIFVKDCPSATDLLKVRRPRLVCLSLKRRRIHGRHRPHGFGVLSAGTNFERHKEGEAWLAPPPTKGHGCVDCKGCADLGFRV
jgi:Kinesin motor domain